MNTESRILHTSIPSPLGDLLVFTDNRSVYRLLFSQSSNHAAERQYWIQRFAAVPVRLENNPAAAQLAQELRLYFSGTLQAFTVPITVQGTVFQKSVWECLCGIPYGCTVSYQDIARKLGNVKASRAVGTANRNNPLPILIPCHRVIHADGTIGGYGGGLSIKRHLLALEKAYGTAFTAQAVTV